MNMETFIIILTLYLIKEVSTHYIDNLSKRDQMRREEMIIDKEKVESMLYQIVASKRLRELSTDYWYRSESISWSVVRAFLKISLK